MPPRHTTAHTTGSLAAAVSGRLIGAGDVSITRLGGLDAADDATLTFIRSPAFLDRWRLSNAAAALVTHDTAEAIAKTSPESTIGPRPLIVVDDPDLALAAILPSFERSTTGVAVGVHPSASVDPAATIHPNARIGPGCVVGPHATIGDGATLIAHVSVAEHASVGAQTVLHPGVVITAYCRIGEHCLFHPNCTIGADGFNFRPAPDGKGLVKIPHLAAVTIEDHVEVGANSAIDRGKFDDTVIGAGTKIDNLVQIGHNCVIGRCCMICGHVGMSGSVTLGDGVVLAGGVGIRDNVTIGSGATVGAYAGVMNDIPPGETWLGAPAQPVRDAMANLNAFRSLSSELRSLRKKVAALQAAMDPATK